MHNGRLAKSITLPRDMRDWLDSLGDDEAGRTVEKILSRSKAYRDWRAEQKRIADKIASEAEEKSIEQPGTEPLGNDAGGGRRVIRSTRGMS